MNLPIVLFDDATWRDEFYPFSVNHSIADLRYGIYTQYERWEKLTGTKVYIQTIDYLSALYEPPTQPEAVFVAANVLPNMELINSLQQLSKQQGLIYAKEKIAYRGNLEEAKAYFNTNSISTSEKNIPFNGTLICINSAIDLLAKNAAIIASDFQFVIAKQQNNIIHPSNYVENTEAIHIASGATVKNVSLNAADGPIYIADNALIMEGSFLRGPIVVGKNSVVKMGSTIYGGTCIGNNCTVGGEVKNSIIMDFSNKAHHGYLGDSIIGNWCNIGAGASNSNIKNSGEQVTVWNDSLKKYSTPVQKCGVLMGDYTRIAINASINTATAIGIACNVFGAGLLPRHFPHFSFGIEKKYSIEQALKEIQQWKSFKNSSTTNQEIKVLQHIFEQLT
ncbi:putative sugar nucleotidyl transferase [Hydrotalea sandarakina]|jgi:UDP-N-acetylglucosamine diphosphorylase/glucosamine-1-phosphate N-acetyltransferase|uniref:UDP-N-acetylglucosamine diphosphorylase/glucosamine-1-phosphate N-acetyltransferase n=1 Tax=Hydrotalea sandarakina TaxID=1004304 RepID=A0A2W7SS88_9BACT|nr:putative sugar nucleotidyl transferase [Hydrotalea sandarakina]PZX65915.1 UDP-N-acetylglucosamine diphosphorylase/glucosamine-1-phosphate N-acetyltransferase [Hydrotalea sandarakina]